MQAAKNAIVETRGHSLSHELHRFQSLFGIMDEQKQTPLGKLETEIRKCKYVIYEKKNHQ